MSQKLLDFIDSAQVVKFLLDSSKKTWLKMSKTSTLPRGRPWVTGWPSGSRRAGRAARASRRSWFGRGEWGGAATGGWQFNMIKFKKAPKNLPKNIFQSGQRWARSLVTWSRSKIEISSVILILTLKRSFFKEWSRSKIRSFQKITYYINMDAV